MAARGSAPPRGAGGTDSFDHDNDGDLDLVMTNGVDFPNSNVEAAFENDPTRMWQNDGAGGGSVQVREVGASGHFLGQNELTGEDVARGRGVLPRRLRREDPRVTPVPREAWRRPCKVSRAERAPRFSSRGSEVMRMASLEPPRIEGTIVLSGGRQLGYAEYGPSSGFPVLWFHGTPGARGQIAPVAREAAHDRAVRIVAIERPGIGASTPHIYDRVRDMAADVEELCDALELDQFAVVGLSGGGPYALACAHEMPERVVTAVLLGGVAPAVGPDKAEGGPTNLVRALSPVIARTYRPMGAMMRQLVRVLTPFADPAIDAFARFMPPGDQRVFADLGVRKMFADDIVAGSTHHMQALFLDAIVFGRHWGFELKGIRVPVHMWYGDADVIVPLEHGQHMTERIPNAMLQVRRDEGHLGGLGASHEVLDKVLAERDKKERADESDPNAS